jgi:DNA-binding response OmpR family regulator
MLYTLMIHPKQILSAEELVEKVWGYHGEGNRELVRGLIQRLRLKIEPDIHNPSYIHTEPGVGYYFSLALT